jgi:Phosphotransferase enzyme family
MLKQDEIVPYLISRGLISSSSIVTGDLSVEDHSRRNFDYKILRKSGPSYFVKMGGGPSGIATVAQEANIYELFNTEPQFSAMYPYLPGFYEFDPLEGVLILEHLRDSQDLQSYHSQLGRFPVSVAAETGRMLAALHRRDFSETKKVKNLPLPNALVWPLSLHRPDLQELPETSNANLQMIGILQRNAEFFELIDQLGKQWEPCTVIHSDIRWTNLLISRYCTKMQGRLKIIDWEFAGLGDPCWDIGSIFNGYLSYWLLSLPVVQDLSPERLLERAHYPLERIQPAVRSFWQAYTNAINVGATLHVQWLLRSIQYGAIRLLHSAYEQMQSSNRLEGAAIYLLQVCFNILQRPQEAIVRLLGISLK